MMQCISSNSVSILVNGNPTEDFVAQRGLRQGQPFGPVSVFNGGRRHNRAREKRPGGKEV